MPQHRDQYQPPALSQEHDGRTLTFTTLHRTRADFFISYQRTRL